MSFITNDLRKDGFGAQYQFLIFIILYTENNNHTFLYTPIHYIAHCLDKEYIQKLLNIMNIQGNYPLYNNNINTRKITTTNNSVHEIYRKVENNLDEYISSSSFIKIKRLFNENNINSYDTTILNIAVHIRRQNKFDNVTKFTTLSKEYDNVLENILSQIQKPYLIHVYSQGNTDNTLKFSNNIIYHIDTDIIDTFFGLVNADILLTSDSSFSYVAALLSDGEVYYKKFWHKPLKKWKVF